MSVRRAFPNKKCGKCGKDAEMLHSFESQNYYCWECFGMPIKRKVNDVEERKHMGKSVRFAWSMVEIANERLVAAGLPRVNSPSEKA